MHSDLFSGGLEPHLFHQLEEDQLVLMFAEAKMGHDSELVELVEEQLTRKQSETAFVSQQDFLLYQIVGDPKANK